MTTFLAILGLIVATGAAWIAYLALKVSHQAQQDHQHPPGDRAETHDQLSWIEATAAPGRCAGTAGCAGSSPRGRVPRHPDRVDDAPLLAIGGFQRRLPVTVILSGNRAFSADAAERQARLGAVSSEAVDAAYATKLFDAANAIGAHTSARRCRYEFGLGARSLLEAPGRPGAGPGGVSDQGRSPICCSLAVRRALSRE